MNKKEYEFWLGDVPTSHPFKKLYEFAPYLLSQDEKLDYLYVRMLESEKEQAEARIRENASIMGLMN